MSVLLLMFCILSLFVLSNLRANLYIRPEVQNRLAYRLDQSPIEPVVCPAKLIGKHDRFAVSESVSEPSSVLYIVMFLTMN